MPLLAAAEDAERRRQTFNSLFEMRVCKGYCRRREGVPAFNSLFEMRNRLGLGACVATRNGFQFSI